jgi:hypothetical protein
MKQRSQPTNDSMAIVRATSYTKSKGAIKATIRYNQHQAGKHGQRIYRELFGFAGVMDRQDAYRMIDAAEKGTVFFRFVISPDQHTEDTEKDLHLQSLTTQTMLALEEQIGRRVPFAAAVHDDHTELRHVHLVACVTARLGKEHFQTMREAATDTARMQWQERDVTQQQQQEGGQWAGQGIS